MLPTPFPSTTSQGIPICGYREESYQCRLTCKDTERMSGTYITWHIQFRIKTLLLIGMKNSFLQRFTYQAFWYLRHYILWDGDGIKYIIAGYHIIFKIQQQITNFFKVISKYFPLLIYLLCLLTVQAKAKIHSGNALGQRCPFCNDFIYQLFQTTSY